MKFTTKRGRPRKETSVRDYGTYETRSKLGRSNIPIDVLFRKRFISEDQHFSALYFRNLFYIRYGSPNAKAYMPKVLKNYRKNPISDSERLDYEQSYLKIISDLKKSKAEKLMLDLCVYDKFPTCIKKQGHGFEELSSIRHSLEVMTKEYILRSNTINL